MKRINLLPQHHVQALDRRHWRRACGILLGTMLVAAPAWIGTAWFQVHKLDRQIATLERDLQPLRQQKEELEHLQREHRNLCDEARTVQLLREPVPTAAILALLTHMVPKEASLRTLLIELPLPIEPLDSRNDAAKKKSNPEAPKPMHIELEGVASVDAAIVGLIGRLAEGGVFRNVRLDDSRAAAPGGPIGHAFRISMDVPWTQQSAVARADRSTP